MVGLKCRKASFRKTQRQLLFSFLASIGASSRPLHVSHIRFFLWKFHLTGFLKLSLLTAPVGMRGRLCHRLSHLTFSSSLLFLQWLRGCVGTCIGHLSSRSSVSPLLRPIDPLSFKFCSARRGGISACVHVSLHKIHPEVSDQMRSVLLSIVHAMMWMCVQACVCSSCNADILCRLHRVTTSIWITKGINSGN